MMRLPATSRRRLFHAGSQNVCLNSPRVHSQAGKGKISTDDVE